MDSDRLITLAIHTYDHALRVKAILEQEGIAVELHNVNLSEPVVAPGVRVRIHESDLPLALRIVENIEIFAPVKGSDTLKPQIILVPVDFSEHSRKGAQLAMSLAARMGCEIEFLYAFVTPGNNDAVQLSSAYDYELADIAAAQALQKEATTMMKRFTDGIRSQIKSGAVPAVKFRGTVTEGLPEEAILDYTRRSKPKMIVMGTRTANKKGAELIGSVTAEVLDSCRVPAFTVPESADLSVFAHLEKVAFFCNLDQEDILALDALYRLFPELNLSVTLLHIPGRRMGIGRFAGRESKDDAHLNLLEYCRSHFLGYTFNIRTLSLKSPMADVTRISQENRFDLICCPNKHRNVFARVFNPGVAHKVLFTADIPMMVIPV